MKTVRARERLCGSDYKRSMLIAIFFVGTNRITRSEMGKNLHNLASTKQRDGSLALPYEMRGRA